ncbi:hypothetical protein tb265_49770 [Gemmatimonadetes bacterium T265]|nr:hypothetical protein tb265_49770 [Gemmatimonadetes bacterium T265]
MTTRVLRIRRPSALLTAQAYEQLFDLQLGSTFAVTAVPLVAWCDAVLGPAGAPPDLSAAGRRFAALTADYDYFAPNFECIPLAPLLLAARNRGGARARLLFIAHAAGAYAFEWALLAPLLAPGDVVVAPSESARRTIEFLCPALRPYLHVVHHPMRPLPAGPARPRSPVPHVVSLGRVHALKLVHRQIEALALLRAARRPTPTMDVGGPLDDAGWAGPHPYTRTLADKVRRLGLTERVRFVGAVRGDAAKGAFLSRADALVNLSVTLEESFPKTPVEALGVGVPVLGTDWNGLRDTVGPCGVLVPVRPAGDEFAPLDVDPADVADALGALVAAPPAPDRCRAWAAQFGPDVILPRYQAVLDRAAAVGEAARHAVPAWPHATTPAAPAAGLLAHAAPLNALAWGDLFTVHAAWASAVRRGWAGGPRVVTDGDRLRSVLDAAVTPDLSRFFARGPAAAPAADVAPPHVPSHTPPRATSGPGTARATAPVVEISAVLATAAAEPGTLAGRLACVGELLAVGVVADAVRAWERIPHAALAPARRAYWTARLSGASERPQDALSHALRACAAAPLGEHDWPYLRELARCARGAGDPAVALDALREWLRRYPDAQESGPVWLELAVNATRARPALAAEADDALQHASALLGDIPAVAKLRRRIDATRNAELLPA